MYRRNVCRNGHTIGVSIYLLAFGLLIVSLNFLLVEHTYDFEFKWFYEVEDVILFTFYVTEVFIFDFTFYSS